MNEPLDPASASGTPDADRPGPMDLFDGPPRSVDRIDKVLSLLRQEWLQFPDERFFQMINNLTTRIGVASYATILEDETLIAMLEQRLDSAAKITDPPDD